MYHKHYLLGEKKDKDDKKGKDNKEDKKNKKMTKDAKPHEHVSCGCRKAAKFVYCMIEKDNKVSEYWSTTNNNLSIISYQL